MKSVVAFAFFLAFAACSTPAPDTGDAAQGAETTAIEAIIADGDANPDAEPDAVADIGVQPEVAAAEITDAEAETEPDSAATEVADDLDSTSQDTDLKEFDAPSPPDIVDIDSPDAAEVDAAKPTADPAGLPLSPCDAGDEAWVKRTMQVVAGRKPTGMAEVDVLVQIAQKTGRVAVVQGLLKLPEAKQRWTSALFDLAHVTRAGRQLNFGCYGLANAPDGDNGKIAAHVRDHAPDQALAVPDITLLDLAHSAFDLDNVSPWFRAQLFGMISWPAEFCKNVTDAEMDNLRRQWFGQKFVALYQNRSLGCLGCHNSSFSVTQTSDPNTNKFFPIPGKFEKAIFGEDTGHTDKEVYQPLRLRGVLSIKSITEDPEMLVWPDDPAPPVSPWQMAGICGMFMQPKDVQASLDASIGWLGGPLTDKASIWDIEQKLHAGIDKLHNDGKNFDETTLANDPDRAFAYMLATRIVSDTWAIVYGEPLTIAHNFPRNASQRDRLMDLTKQFIQSDWSLKKLVTAMVTEAPFNELSGNAACGVSGAYSLPPLFYPYSTNEEIPEMKGNSPADGIHREEPFVLVFMAAHAAGWAAPPVIDSPPGAMKLEDNIGFPQPGNLGELAFRIGAFLDDARPGAPDMDAPSLGLWRTLVANCRVELPDKTVLTQGVPDGKDWMDQLLALPTTQTATVAEVIGAIRDRIITEPDLPKQEAASALALFGAATLGTPMTALLKTQDAARAYCGALLASPQFWLTGQPAPNQVSRSKLLQKDATFQARCKALAGLILDPVFYSVDCGVKVLNFVKKP